MDIDLFIDIRRIENSLKSHCCTEALTWCSENKAALRKAKSTLEFDLRLQEYIELARTKKAVEAIAYLRKHLIPWQDTHLSDIRKASALLAFPPSTTCVPYKVSPLLSTSYPDNRVFTCLFQAIVRPQQMGWSSSCFPTRSIQS